MSECSICNNYSDDLHPVDFGNTGDPDFPEELKEYVGIGSYFDDTDASDANEEFWEKCAHICHECFKYYWPWIQWWG